MDNLNIRGPQDPTKINVNEYWEVYYWCKKWGVTEQQLRYAVSVVGPGTTKVKTYLGN